jgi:5'-3' exonuclease
MIVHLIDGTYELFRHFYGHRRYNKGDDKPFAAVVGVLHGVLQMIEEGATHVGVATDHVIESFRNDLWSEYKTGAGIERALRAQFHPLEDALAAMGIVGAKTASFRLIEGQGRSEMSMQYKLNSA